MGRITRKVRFAQWTLNGYFGRTLSLKIPQKLTVLITYYQPVRMKHIGPQLRNILKCNFVEKVLVSNHNPDVRIEDKVHVRDNRVVCINQDIARPCGYRWRIANLLEAEYLVAVDDGILLFPSQLKALFQYLISEPDIPHGVSGMLHLENDEFQFREREDIDVDYLCEVYAVTKKHVERYFDTVCSLVDHDEALPATIERLGDFIVISQTGARNPRIHNVGRLFRSDTFKTQGRTIRRQCSEGFPRCERDQVQTHASGQPVSYDC
jgi:hypothetical protein